MPERFATEVQTTLSSSATNTAATISVASATGLAAGQRIRVEDAPAGSGTNREFMLVDSVSGTTVTVARGREGTTAVAHGSGSVVTVVATAEILQATSIDTLMGSRMMQCGHSLAAGFGQSGPDKDTITRETSVLKVREIPLAKNGAILQYQNVDPDAAGNGGWNTLSQYLKRRAFPSGTVRTATSGSVTSLNVSDPQDGPWNTLGIQMASIGSGTTAVTAYVSGVSGSSGSFVLTFASAVTLNVSVGDTVQLVPSVFEAPEPLYSLWWGLNDIAANGTGEINSGFVGNGKKSFTESLKAMVCRCCSEFVDANNGAFSRSTNAASGASPGVAMGAYVRALNTATHQATWDVPASFMGGDLYLFFVVQANAGGVMSFTRNGSASGTLDTRNAGVNGKWLPFVKVFKSVPAGGHTIVATVTTAGTQQYLTGAGIGYEATPAVRMYGFNRAVVYDIWTNSFNYGSARGTVNANHGSGVASFTITAPVDSGAAAITLRRGELITFDQGTANEETLEIAADAAGTTVTTTTNSTKAHNTGQTYQGNIHDAAITQRAVNWIPELIAAGELPATAFHVPIDDVLAKDPLNFTYDRVHLSDRGAARVADRGMSYLRRSGALEQTLAVRTSTPVAPLPSAIYFLGPVGTAVAGVNDPGGSGAVAEAFPDFRQARDVRRATYARFVAFVTAVSTGLARARAEYSLDGGTTWKTLAKKPTGADTAIGTAGEVGQVPVGTETTANSRNTSAWFLMPAEVWSVADVLFRVAHGNRTTGTTDPTYKWLALEFA